jgi:cell division protein FtsL
MNTQKLIPCVQCGNQISSIAKSCPECKHKKGDPQKKEKCYCCDKELKYSEGVSLENRGVIHSECKKIISEYASTYSSEKNRSYHHEFSCSACQHINTFSDQVHRVCTECKKCGHPKTSKVPQRSYDVNCIHCSFMLNEFSDDSVLLHRLGLRVFIHAICCPPHLKNQREEVWLKEKELKEGVKTPKSIDPDLSLLSPAQVRDLRDFIDKSTLLIRMSDSLQYLSYDSDGDTAEYNRLVSGRRDLAPKTISLLDSLLSEFLSRPYKINDKSFIRNLEPSTPRNVEYKPRVELEEYYRKQIERISYKQLTDRQKRQLEQIEYKLSKLRRWSTRGEKIIHGWIVFAIVMLVVLSPFMYSSYQKHQINQATLEKVEKENERLGEIYTSILINGGPVEILDAEKVNEILGTSFFTSEKILLTSSQMNKLKSSTNSLDEKIVMFYKGKLKVEEYPAIRQLVDPREHL